MPLVSSKLITNIIFSIYRTPLTLELYILIIYTGPLLQDTSVIPYIRLPVSTNSATRDRLRDCRNLRQSTAICHSLPYSATFY
jgi:hypothetical protein